MNRDIILSKTLQFMRKADPGLTGVRSLCTLWQLNSHWCVGTLRSLRRTVLQIIARSTVVFVAVWKPDDTATKPQQKAGRGEWVCCLICSTSDDAMLQPPVAGAQPNHRIFHVQVECGDGPMFICTRASAPYFQLIIKPRSQTQSAL